MIIIRLSRIKHVHILVGRPLILEIQQMPIRPLLRLLFLFFLLFRRGLIYKLIVDAVVKVAVVVHLVLPVEVFDAVRILNHFLVENHGVELIATIQEPLMDLLLHTLVRPGRVEGGEDK